MQERTLDNGLVISRSRSPFGTGHLYYISGGKEGDVLVADTHMVPLSVIAECIAWDLDYRDVDYGKLTMEFNKR